MEDPVLKSDLFRKIKIEREKTPKIKPVKLKKEHSEVLPYIGKRLKDLRAKSGYTSQEDFAHDAGIARIQYAGYERGKNMTICTIKSIVDFYEISFSDFFYSI